MRDAQTLIRFQIGPVGGLIAAIWMAAVAPAQTNLPGVDFGDAPDDGLIAHYATTLANTGAYHVIDGSLYLGNGVDEESDGQPNVAATGDDQDANGDDEDGIQWLTSLEPGHNVSVSVVASEYGLLNAWMDFNQDGRWEPQEHILSGQPVNGGTNVVIFVVSPDAALGSTYVRFRFSGADPLEPFGPAPNGEVEDYLVQVVTYDFGDAPDDGGETFATLLVHDGARHSAKPGILLGADIDAEEDGQISLDASGDDLSGSDDEDGVLFHGPLLRGVLNTIQIVTTTNGYLQAWLDFNQDAVWSNADERVLEDVAVTAGVHTVQFTVPNAALLGAAFARFRFSTQPGLGTSGAAPDGEVEDYQVEITDADFGDAPDSGYATTLANTGAYHSIEAGFFLGDSIDTDLDGQPTPGALGDDQDVDGDDEDGIRWLMELVPGRNVNVEITASGPGFVNAWMDFGQDSSWAEAGDQIALNHFLQTGLNLLVFTVPENSSNGYTYSRFRFSSEEGLGPSGPAPDGEVEDHQVLIRDMDFGDAPDNVNTNYPTQLINNGARHVILPEIYLGAGIDFERDGQQSELADGDDANGPFNDEDGVAFLDALQPGLNSAIQVVSSTNGYLQAWLDVAHDGSWYAPEDHIIQDVQLVAGTNVLGFRLSPYALAGSSFARFRFSTQPGVAVDELASDGEVEDYRVDIQAPVLDFGDAPSVPPAGMFSTLLVDNGARHLMIPGIHLGASVDSEADGQPSDDFSGDDVNGNDDDDGVTPVSTWTPGVVGLVTVSASTSGYLQAWVDFGADGTWIQAEDRVIRDIWLSAGTTNIAISVPHSVGAEELGARFRFSTADDLGFNGFAPDGEVEDLRVFVFTNQLDFGDAPGGLNFPTTLAENGARHGLIAGIRLGAVHDAETDGQPSSAADGDDTDADGDDEDGVDWLNALQPGALGVIQVSVSTPGLLQAWIDYDRDGSWSGANEQVFVDRLMGSGSQLLAFAVPPAASLGATFARFRFATAAGLGVTDIAEDGEVEDYAVAIVTLPAVTPGSPCTVWLQRPNHTNGIDIQSWALPSLGPTNGLVARAADDWPSDGRALSGFRWWGSYLGWHGNPSAVPASSRPYAFRLTLYADGVSTNDYLTPVPGVALTNITAGLLAFGNLNAATGLVSEQLFSTSNISFTAPPTFEYEYEYGVKLLQFWPLVPERRYWLGIEALLQVFPTYRWGWCTAFTREGFEARATLRKMSDREGVPMTYPPNVVPWANATNHPDRGAPVDLALELFTLDCPRRAHQWPQDMGMDFPTGAASWYRLDDLPGQAASRADDWVSEGRRVASLLWQGTYRGWLGTTPGSPTNPVTPPTDSARPLGFAVAWMASDGLNCQPGAVLTNLFVPLERCREQYVDTFLSPLTPADPFMHVYQYTADLLDPLTSGQAWPTVTGGLYWVSIQAVFANAFAPEPATHNGWDWQTAGDTQRCASVVSTDAGFTWNVSAFSPPHPFPGQPFDLVFDLLSDRPGLSPLYDQPEILSFSVNTNGRIALASIGDLGSGVQVLQSSSNLISGSWIDIQTNPLPRELPYTNLWLELSVPGSNAALRVLQR